MWRVFSMGLVVVFAAAVMLAPASAQDGDFDDTEQAALDEVRTALENFLELNTYSAEITQLTKQDIGMAYLGQAVRLEQQVEAQGTIQWENAADGKLNNQQISLSEMVSQNLTGAGTDQNVELGPVLFDLIVVDDRLYMRMKIESDTSGMLPKGWVDVTEGAEAFPGMGMFDIEQMLKIGDVIGEEFITALLAAVVEIETTEPTGVEGQMINHYRLELDPVLALESIGSTDLESMFDSSAIPFDVAGLIALIYTDEDTTFTIDLGIEADDRRLVELTQVVTMDLLIGPELITDETLKDAEMTMLQTANQSYRFYGFDEPVTITAPDLSE